MLCYVYADIDWLSQAAISRTVSLLVTLPVALLTGRHRRAAPVPHTGCRRRRSWSWRGLTLLTITYALGPPTVAGVTTTQIGTFAVILGLRGAPRAPEAQPVGRHRLHHRRGDACWPPSPERRLCNVPRRPVFR